MHYFLHRLLLVPSHLASRVLQHSKENTENLNLLFSSCFGLLTSSVLYVSLSLSLSCSLTPFFPPSPSLFVSLSFPGLCVRGSLCVRCLSAVLQTHMGKRIEFEEILTVEHSCSSALHLHTRANAPSLSLFFLSF